MALTGRDLKFAVEYLKTGNATKSAISVGYSVNGAAVRGSLLLKKPEVRKYLEGGKSQAASYAIKRAKLEAAEILARIIDIHDAALGDSDYGAALRAMELYGKHLHMFAEQVEVNHSHSLVALVVAASRAPAISMSRTSQGTPDGTLAGYGEGTPDIHGAAKIPATIPASLPKFSNYFSETSLSPHSRTVEGQTNITPAAAAAASTINPSADALPSQPSSTSAETKLTNVLPSGGVLPQEPYNLPPVNRMILMRDSSTESSGKSIGASDSISGSSDDNGDLG